MTNKEFFGDKLLAVVLKGNCDALYRMVHGENCAGLFCGDCEFGITKESEIENVLQWLNAEHVEPEPPLLENGDYLEPGEWIMVRNDSGLKWQKRCFMCYRYGYFITVSGGRSIGTMGGYEAWKQACLPMEYE